MKPGSKAWNGSRSRRIAIAAANELADCESWPLARANINTDAIAAARKTDGDGPTRATKRAKKMVAIKIRITRRRTMN